METNLYKSFKENLYLKTWFWKNIKNLYYTVLKNDKEKIDETVTPVGSKIGAQEAWHSDL